MTLGWLNSTGRYGRRCWTNSFALKFLHVPLGVGGWPLGYEEQRYWANCSRNLFARFSTNMVMIHQCHRQTDRQTTCDLKTALCAIVHRTVTNTEFAYDRNCHSEVQHCDHASDHRVVLKSLSKQRSGQDERETVKTYLQAMQGFRLGKHLELDQLTYE